jgi:DNA-directed RNA polymerase specialized sigma24 family protein
MSQENELQHMLVADLAEKCAQETQHYFRKRSTDSSYCLELFRRAILRRDEDAWGALYHQYQPQVERWVYRHADFPALNQDAEDFTMQALERFYKYFTAEKFNKSRSLAAILNYLQMCVNGVILDCWRKMHQAQIEQMEEDDERTTFGQEPSTEDLLESGELWQLVKNRLKDEKEYTVVYASISLDLSPRQILAEYPDVFDDISEIYRCSANVWARLERDPEIRKFVALK